MGGRCGDGMVIELNMSDILGDLAMEKNIMKV